VLRDGWPVAVEERGIRTELDPEGARGSRARREGPPSGTGSHPELVDQ
jgi:hypothetical protein